MQVLEVRLWGGRVGALGWDAGQGIARFQYDAEFLRAGLQLSPLQVLGTRQIQQFPALAHSRLFMGLPGFIADSLPGAFAGQLWQAWLAAQGRQWRSHNPLERLALIGNRGSGALEYLPDSQAQQRGVAMPLHLASLASGALKLQQANHDIATFGADELDLLVTACGSAGHSEAQIGWQPESGQILTGQANLPAGFEHWVVRLDGTSGTGPTLNKSSARIAYACNEMAHAAGINTMEGRLHHADGHVYFMTRRCDRVDGNAKVHRVSFAGLLHADREPAGAYSYEQLFQTLRDLRLGQETLNEMYRRLAFNICTHHRQDHTGSHAFLMFGDGVWQLAPASAADFSAPHVVTQHQMTCNGKRDNFTLDDLLAAAKAADVKRPLLQLERVQAAIERWPEFADKAGLPEKLAAEIASRHRLFIESSQVSTADSAGPAQGSLF